VDNSPQPLSVLSLCTGYGGIERGLELAGVRHRVITHVEIEAFAIANLVNKMEAGELDAAPVWTNLKTLPVDCFRDRISILTGGYPCQPFSAAGKRAGADDPRHLWPYIYDIIRAVRPVQCFFENVEGHISLGLREVIEDLESLGYAATWGVFSAAEVGAPHQRKRVFILANAHGYALREQSRRGSGTDGQGQAISGNDGERQHLVDTNGPGLEAFRDELRAKRQADAVGESSELADAKSIGVQGLRPSGQPLTHAHGQSQLSLREGEGSRPAQWPAEPRLGRVVDGCPDRVDRIRLLGNGVVPQTAAKAWLVLNEQIASE